MNYTDFLENAHKSSHYDEQEVQRIVAQLTMLTKGGLAGFNSYFIADYNAKKHVLLSTGNINNFSSEAILDGGLEFVLSRWHGSDLNVFNKEIFGHVMRIINNATPDEVERYIFSTTYRVIDAKGAIRTLLQNSKYMFDPATGLPLYSYGTTTDITDFKADSSMLWKVTKSTEQFEAVEEIEKMWFFPDKELSVFSPRELEVLKMVADGLSVKEIAEKMGVAVRTVVNHKQSMFHKANVKNIAELVKYALNNKDI